LVNVSCALGKNTQPPDVGRGSLSITIRS
jgi:hypothetical protein